MANREQTRKMQQEMLNANVAKIPDEVGDKVRELFLHFLEEFQIQPMEANDEPSSQMQPTLFPYRLQAEDMARTETTTMYVDWEHLVVFGDFMEVTNEIRENFARLEPFLNEAVQQFMVKHEKQHAQLLKSSNALRAFFVSFYNMEVTTPIRQLHTSQLGRLVTVCGTVTRSSQVRPELVKGSFTCGDCNTMNPGIAQQFKYTEPRFCVNPVCENREKWKLNVAQSEFVDWQKLRVQEDPSQIEAGSMPRSLNVILRHEAVEQAKPGDRCLFTGTLVVVPDVSQLSRNAVSVTRRRGARESEQIGVGGLKALGVRDLTYQLCFVANNVRSFNSSANVRTIHDETADNAHSFTEAERATIYRMKDTEKIYSKLVASVVPTTFGHEEVKRGILLMLFGGVHKKTADNANLRGDINVCIVGDPSTSKSQFLKYVVNFMPRAIYTSGKASSAAGLTASVARDSETGEYCIEAGALMLADQGICCIDEFDKMDPTDQVAIHEAMEQQTISIAKAGIQATLNARASILAAANPIAGRYDTSRSLKQNVDMTAPIMSRFDLFFVVLDQQDDMVDANIARHIVNTHANLDAALATAEFSREDIQTYVRYARGLNPKITPAAAKAFEKQFVRLRNRDLADNKSSYRITIRQLESMIRLAEARARIDLSSEVTVQHVNEAARLIQMSIVHVTTDDIVAEPDEDYIPPAGGGGGDDDDNSGGGGGGGDGDAAHDGDAPMDKADKPPTPKKQITLSFKAYQHITQLLVHHLRRTDPEERGTPQHQLISWFTQNEQSANVNESTPAELQNLFRTVKMVINRLLTVDHVLMVRPSEGDDDVDVPASERLLIVHPNYDTDNLAPHVHLAPSDAPVVRTTGGNAAAAASRAPAEEQKEDENKEQEQGQEQEDENKQQEQAEESAATASVEQPVPSRRKRRLFGHGEALETEGDASSSSSTPLDPMSSLSTPASSSSQSASSTAPAGASASPAKVRASPRRKA